MHTTTVPPTSSEPNQAERTPARKTSANGARPEIKIAYLGGGSREWAGKLMADLALTEKLSGRLVLHDIDIEAARRNVGLADEIFGHPQARSRFEVRVEADLARALKGADFVIISIEPGPTQLRFADLEIPAKFGVLQTVGDTTGPGGIMRALRTIPIYQRFAHAIMEHCPRAWVINYTNPMALCVASLFACAPEIKAFGCCHEVFSTQTLLAQKVAKWFEVEAPHRSEIDLDIAGVNHFTWATSAAWHGHDLMPRLRRLVDDDAIFADASAFAQNAREKESWFTSRHLIAYDFLRRFGALGAAGDRHLAEFVPWYLTSEEELHRWGVVTTPFSWRLERSQQAPSRIGAAAKKGLTPSGEEGVGQIEALMGLRSLRTNVNLPNRGQIPALPLGAVVETYALMNGDRVTPLVAQPLPTAAAALVERSVKEQEMVLKAALEGDLDLAFQAMLTHPLVTIPTDRARAMFDEMADLTRHMLPMRK